MLQDLSSGIVIIHNYTGLVETYPKRKKTLYLNNPSERVVAGMLGCSKSAVHNAIHQFQGDYA